jgi:peptidoglycan hydrolase CwlO-like protein
MEASSMSSATIERSDLRSRRPGAVIWSLGRSVKTWKAKAQNLRGELRRLQNRVRDVHKSREQWKQQAEQAKAEASAMQAEFASLKERLKELERGKKKSRCRRS